MALAHLAGCIAGALARMFKAPVVDDKVLANCLNDVSRALLQADVRFETVRTVQASIRSAVSLQSLGTDRHRAIKQAVEAELRRMLDPGPEGKPSLAPTRGKKPASVVMLVGLEGSGKTTTCVKYADYHRRKCSAPRWCAPTTLLEEMRQATRPDLVVLVIDASIGQAAFDQVLAFASVGVGAVMVTKMDAHAKGAGALSALAATKSPVIFIGTGEDVSDLEAFDASSFVRRLLGMGHLPLFMDDTRIGWPRIIRQKDHGR